MTSYTRIALIGLVCALIVGAFVSGYFSGQQIKIVATKSVTEYFPTQSPYYTTLTLKVRDTTTNATIAKANLTIYGEHSQLIQDYLREIGATDNLGSWNSAGHYLSSELLIIRVQAKGYVTELITVSPTSRTIGIYLWPLAKLGTYPSGQSYIISKTCFDFSRALFGDCPTTYYQHPILP